MRARGHGPVRTGRGCRRPTRPPGGTARDLDLDRLQRVAGVLGELARRRGCELADMARFEPDAVAVDRRARLAEQLAISISTDFSGLRACWVNWLGAVDASSRTWPGSNRTRLPSTDAPAWRNSSRSRSRPTSAGCGRAG